GQGNPVARRDGRVRRLAKHLSRATRREQRRVRADFASRAALLEEADAAHDAVVDDQVGDERVIGGVDGSERDRALPERATDLAACGIPGVKNAANTMRRFEAQRRLAGPIAIEPDAP